MITVSKVNRLKAFVNATNPARCLLRVVKGLCVRVTTGPFLCLNLRPFHLTVVRWLTCTSVNSEFYRILPFLRRN